MDVNISAYVGGHMQSYVDYNDAYTTCSQVRSMVHHCCARFLVLFCKPCGYLLISS